MQPRHMSATRGGFRAIHSFDPLCLQGRITRRTLHGRSWGRTRPSVGSPARPRPHNQTQCRRITVEYKALSTTHKAAWPSLSIALGRLIFPACRACFCGPSLWRLRPVFGRLTVRLCLALLLSPTKNGRGVLEWLQALAVARRFTRRRRLIRVVTPLGFEPHCVQHSVRRSSSWLSTWNRRPLLPRLTCCLSAQSVSRFCFSPNLADHKSARIPSPACIHKHFHNIPHTQADLVPDASLCSHI